MANLNVAYRQPIRRSNKKGREIPGPDVLVQEKAAFRRMIITGASGRTSFR